MYEPPHFRETRAEVLHELIRAHPLGLLVCNGPGGPVANAVPFLIDPEPAPHGRLRAHVAKANQQWRMLAEAPDTPVLVVFQGVDAYITPSWYETKRETGKVVPTWNYVMVQVRGRARVMAERDWLHGQITELTTAHEGSRAGPWLVTDAPEPFVEAQIKGIIGIEIDISEIHGKWKVSQNRPVPDRVGVAQGLREHHDEGSAKMAELVREFGGLDE
jgi:transcriptional regulator